MCTFVAIENVAANALLAVRGKKENEEISFDELVRYGMKAISIFQEETSEEAALLLSRAYQISMMEHYSNFFQVDMYRKRGVFCLTREVSMHEVSMHEFEKVFRWTMDSNLVDAFMSPEAISELGV